MIRSVMKALARLIGGSFGAICLRGSIMRLMVLLLSSLCVGPAAAMGKIIYFPEGDYQCRADGNFLKTYENLVTELNLPSLWKISLMDSDTEAYRFMLMPAFSSTIIVQIIKAPDRSISADIFEVGEDGSSLKRKVPFRVRGAHAQITLTGKKFNQFTNLLSEGGFWELYHFGWGSGFDTWVWVIEGIKDGQHHFFSSSDPVPKKIREAVRYMHEDVMGVPFEQ